MYNRVILMGRLTADPELKQTQSGIAMCRFRVAVDKPAKQGEEKKADFISVTCWKHTAEFVCRYFAKGKMIHLEGRLQNNDYTDQNNVKHYSMEVVADNVAFCGDKGNSSQTQQNSYYQQPQQGGYYQQNQQRSASAGNSLPYAPAAQAATGTPQQQNGYYQQPPTQPPQYQQPVYQRPPAAACAPAQKAANASAGTAPPDILGDFDVSEFQEILGDGDVPF